MKRFFKSLYTQYAIYLLCAMLVSALVAVKMISPSVLRLRAEISTLLLGFAQETSEDGRIRVSRIQPITALMGIEAWEVDKDGTIQSSTSQNVLPLDWKQIQLPADDEVRAVTTFPFRPAKMLFTFRIAGLAPRYLIFYFSRAGQFLNPIYTFLCFYSLLLASAAIIGMIFFNQTWEGRRHEA